MDIQGFFDWVTKYNKIYKCDFVITKLLSQYRGFHNKKSKDLYILLDSTGF